METISRRAPLPSNALLRLQSISHEKRQADTCCLLVNKELKLRTCKIPMASVKSTNSIIKNSTNPCHLV